jgi:hypothetical protein
LPVPALEQPEGAGVGDVLRPTEVAVPEVTPTLPLKVGKLRNDGAEVFRFGFEHDDERLHEYPFR